ncbi:MAG: hypothetical protein JNK82_34435 [Myxococcaceae bacterium]|nr:hypothetical protein [Myxococcaceae bacterium]
MAGGSSGAVGGRSDGGSAVDAGPPLDGGYFVCPGVTGAGRIATMAAQMAAGEWRELPSPGWNYNLLYTDCNGATGSTAHTDWSDELFWNARTQSVMFIGAGHLRSFGFVFFTDAVGSWCRNDVEVDSCMRETGYSACFTHAYDHQAFDPGRGRLMMLNAGLGVYEYDVAARSWSNRTLPSGVPGAQGGYGRSFEYFASRDQLFVGLGSTGVMVGRFGGPVTSLAAMPGVGPYHNTGVYLPHHRAVLYGGGNDSKKLYVIDEQLMVRSVPDVTFPAGVSDVIHVAETTLTYDPIYGDGLLLSKEGTFHAYDYATNAWRRLADPPWRGQPGYSHALAAPIDDHQVVLFAFPQSAYKVWLYKPAP